MTPRDALAAALHDNICGEADYDPQFDLFESHHKPADAILTALAAEGWVLTRAAPDPAPLDEERLARAMMQAKSADGEWMSVLAQAAAIAREWRGRQP